MKSDIKWIKPQCMPDHQKWIWANLHKKGKSQAGLAKAIGLSEAVIRALATGKTARLTVHEVEAMAAYFDDPSPAIPTEVKRADKFDAPFSFAHLQDILTLMMRARLSGDEVLDEMLSQESEEYEEHGMRTICQSPDEAAEILKFAIYLADGKDELRQKLGYILAMTYIDYSHPKNQKAINEAIEMAGDETLRHLIWTARTIVPEAAIDGFISAQTCD
jgi:DNA-binding Xre family transcriptional regulator